VIFLQTEVKLTLKGEIFTQFVAELSWGIFRGNRV